MWFICLRDLRYRRRRSMLAIAGTAVILAVGLLGSAVTTTLHAEVRETFDAIGADAWIVPASSTGPLTSTSLLPEHIGHAPSPAMTVGGVDPVLYLPNALRPIDGSRSLSVIGYRSGGLGEPPLHAGRHAIRPGEIVVDTSSRRHIGDLITVRGASMLVVGTTDGLTLERGTPIAWLPIEHAQALTVGGRALASTFAVRGTPGAAPAGTIIVSDDDARADAIGRSRTIIATIRLGRLLLAILAATIIGAMVHGATRDRTRDIAMLRAIGSPRGVQMAGVAMQGTVLAAAAGVVAIAVCGIALPMLPVPLAISGGMYAMLLVSAGVIGLVGSIAGLRRAARILPVMALEGM